MPTSNWRPAPTDPQAFTLGSEFQFRDPLTPAEAVQLVQGQNLHFAFGDSDDHLARVRIGGYPSFVCVSCSRLTYFIFLIDWLRNRTCLL